MGNLNTEFDPQSWKSTTWGELAELKYGKGLKGYRESMGVFPVYGTNGPVGWCDKPLCNYPSVIVGRKGAYRGIHFSDEPFYVIDTAFYIQPKMDFNLKWAYYSLLLVDINGMDSGSAIPSTSREDFYAIPVRVPPRSIQDSIVDQLDSLNNKIELNRQTNETLEKMAQALFKSWFVDFDPVIDNALAAGNTIPDELQDRAERRQQQLAKPDHQPLPDAIRQLFPSEFELTEDVGWVPMGWEVKPFGDLLEMTIGGDWGKDVPDEKHTVESVIVRGTDIPKLTSGSQSSAPARWVEPKKLKTRSLSDSDIVIEVSGGSSTQPTGRSIMMTKNLLDRLGGTVEPASFCRKFRPLNREIGLVLGLHLRNIYADGKTWEYQNTSTGISNFQTKMFLANELVLTPNSNKLISEFYRIVRPIIDRITNNDSIHLEKLRDTLLPKLISGELRLPPDALPDAEQKLADAAS